MDVVARSRGAVRLNVLLQGRRRGREEEAQHLGRSTGDGATPCFERASPTRSQTVRREHAVAITIIRCNDRLVLGDAQRRIDSAGRQGAEFVGPDQISRLLLPIETGGPCDEL